MKVAREMFLKYAKGLSEMATGRNEVMRPIWRVPSSIFEMPYLSDERYLQGMKW